MRDTRHEMQTGVPLTPLNASNVISQPGRSFTPLPSTSHPFHPPPLRSRSPVPFQRTHRDYIFDDCDVDTNPMILRFTQRHGFLLLFDKIISNSSKLQITFQFSRISLNFKLSILKLYIIVK